MISTYQRLKRRRDAGEIDGFTLIELLIVIVVLGILAAVVIFALGGITGKSAVAACQADGATVSTAAAAWQAQNAGSTLTQSALTTPDSTGNQYLQSWPSNGTHYAFSVATGSGGSGTGAYVAGDILISVPATSTPTKFLGPSSCSGVS